MKQNMLFILILLVCSLALSAATIEITSPKAGEVKGTLNFEVNVTGMERSDTVTYYINGRQISPAINVAPYNFTYYTQVIFDGPANLTARIQDKNQRVLAESEAIELTVQNEDAKVTVTGVDFTQTLSGVINYTVKIDEPLTEEEVQALLDRHQSPDKSIEAILTFLDGKMVGGINWGSHTIQRTIDTTTLTNGEHELYITAWACKDGLPPVIQYSTKFMVENEPKPIGITIGYTDRYIYLDTDNKSQKFTTKLVYTDNNIKEIEAEQIKSLTLTSDNDEIVKAAVGKDNSLNILAVKAGAATITITLETEEDTYSEVVPIFVKNKRGFPHFTKDGQIIDKYDPKNSLYITNMFMLSATDIANTPGLYAEIKEAKINTISTGFFRNPADSGDKLRSFEDWKKGWEPYFDEQVQMMKTFNLSGILIGDDFCRTANEMSFVVENPQAKEIVAYAFEKARDAKIFTSVEMVDEVSFGWGSTPIPANPDAWAHYNPPIPNDAFKRLLTYINNVKGHTPISWPIGGISGNDAAQGWLGDPRVSDYNSHYWDVVEWRKAYSDRGSSYPQIRAAIDRVFYGRYPYIQGEKPTLMLAGVCGPFYFKLSEGKAFNPEKDKTRTMGTIPTMETVAYQMMYHTIIGGSGVRAYAFDGAWDRERASQPVGYEGETQTGASPFTEGSDRWQSMSSSFNLLSILEPYLLQPIMSSPFIHRDIKTTVRSGNNGILLMAVNTSESPIEINVPLINNANNLNFIRYRLLGASLSTDVIKGAAFDSITLEPAETVAYLILTNQLTTTNDVIPPSVKINIVPNMVVNGTLPIEVTADDNLALESINLYINGVLTHTWKNNDLKGELIYEWDTTTSNKQDKWQSISVVANDIGGNNSMSRATVLLKNY